MRVKCMLGTLDGRFTRNADYELESCECQLLARDDKEELTVLVGPEVDWAWFTKHFVFVQEKPQGYVDVELLSDRVREDIMERLDIDDPAKFPKDMTPLRALDCWLQYQGIIGYTGVIVDTINDVNQAASDGCGREVFP